MDKVAVPGTLGLPVVGGKGESNGSIFAQPLIVYIGLALAVLVAWMLRRTHRASTYAQPGSPAALDAAGVSVFATRSWAVLFRRDGGARRRLPVDRQRGLFQDTVVGGRGFIAIVLAMLARGRPLWAVVGPMLFGASLSIADWAQVAQINISTDLVFMLPFVLVLVVLVLFGRRAYLPAALALPYERGTR